MNTHTKTHLGSSMLFDLKLCATHIHISVLSPQCPKYSWPCLNMNKSILCFIFIFLLFCYFIFRSKILYSLFVSVVLHTEWAEEKTIKNCNDSHFFILCVCICVCMCDGLRFFCTYFILAFCRPMSLLKCCTYSTHSYVLRQNTIEN